MRDLGTGVWVFFSLPFSITLRAGAAIVSWVSVFSFLFLSGFLEEGSIPVVARMILRASRISASLLLADVSF
jgi:hypothetical protein